MTTYVILNNGRVVGAGVSAAKQDIARMRDQGCDCLEVDADYTQAASWAGRHYVVAGEVRELPPQPDPHHVWDLASESWVDPRSAEQVAEDDAEVISALWSELRNERDRRLSICDWTQVADVPMAAEVRAAWASYRQALRDLPETTTDPAAPIWPEAPNA